MLKPSKLIGANNINEVKPYFVMLAIHVPASPVQVIKAKIGMILEPFVCMRRAITLMLYATMVPSAAICCKGTALPLVTKMNMVQIMPCAKTAAVGMLCVFNLVNRSGIKV